MLEESRLSQSIGHMFYQLRWGVEVFFRSLKQTLCRRKLASAPRPRRDWNCTGRWRACGCWGGWALTRSSRPARTP